MKIQNTEGKELNPEEIDELSGGKLLYDVHFECQRCGKRLEGLPTQNQSCPCGYIIFQMVYDNPHEI
jgi:DNA-directed RNA polymerase subunit RPC12/RpoP